MSGEGPESVPTSADPRSKRPTKKRALTPVSEQAAHLDALFAKPDQEIRFPTGDKKPRLAAPPEIVTNVQGSSAGAGSGEFHVYKASRRRENERLRVMDEELKKEQEKQEFERRRAENGTKDDEKTRKNREKREKKKAAKLRAIQADKSKSNTEAAKAAKSGGDDSGDGDGGGDGKNEGSDAGLQPISAVMAAAAETARAEASNGNGTPGSAQTPGIVIHDDD
ncbi:hypothetical protein MCOR25_010544 [Pyricularia grisea]|uniref:DUF1168 domain-containing protein n=1 Tax=Pyricularia grisea TaxID=148305 RepID=A0A6P8B7G1_PYRGI|nr:hypothetical protein PgNI_05692 [Pyricularia grisea]KAI6350433.1 hypothetical protein MCOR25_010544 [Pyricularia grisea]TLD11210.1 hypothetical protein PgNI_05692 [Pyricularia grisea]